MVKEPDLGAERTKPIKAIPSQSSSARGFQYLILMAGPGTASAVGSFFQDWPDAVSAAVVIKVLPEPRARSDSMGPVQRHSIMAAEDTSPRAGVSAK